MFSLIIGIMFSPHGGLCREGSGGKAGSEAEDMVESELVAAHRLLLDLRNRRLSVFAILEALCGWAFFPSSDLFRFCALELPLELTDFELE
jgi:hypothetical protein